MQRSIRIRNWREARLWPCRRVNIHSAVVVYCVAGWQDVLVTFELVLSCLLLLAPSSKGSFSPLKIVDSACQ